MRRGPCADLAEWSSVVNPSEIRELGDVRRVTQEDASRRKLRLMAKSARDKRQKVVSRHTFQSVCLGSAMSAMVGKQTLTMDGPGLNLIACYGSVSWLD